MFGYNTTEVPAQTTDEQDVVDPRIEFAHQLVSTAYQLGGNTRRAEAVSIVQRVLPEYRPQHPATGFGEQFANRLGVNDPAQRDQLVRAFTEGYDAGRNSY